MGRKGIETGTRSSHIIMSGGYPGMGSVINEFSGCIVEWTGRILWRRYL